MSRDRPELLRQLVRLFRFYGNRKDDLIISDNSSTLANIRAVKDICAEHECILWENRNLTVASHYHRILSSIDYEYLTVIHDDDLIMPGYLSAVESQLCNGGTFSVVGYNALTFQAPIGSRYLGEIKCSGRRTLNEASEVLITEPLELLLRWVSPFCNGIAPLSGCTFNLKFYDKCFYDIYSSAELYFDTVLMMLFSEKAPIKWLAERTMILLREHDSRLTSIASVHDEIVFADTALTHFSRYWKIYPILKFYLYARRCKRKCCSPLEELLNYVRYFVFLIMCLFIWPERIPRLLRFKLAIK